MTKTPFPILKSSPGEKKIIKTEKCIAGQIKHSRHYNSFITTKYDDECEL